MGVWLLHSLSAELLDLWRSYRMHRSIRKWAKKWLGSFFNKMELVRLICMTLYCLQYVAISCLHDGW